MSEPVDLDVIQAEVAEWTKKFRPSDPLIERLEKAIETLDASGYPEAQVDHDQALDVVKEALSAIHAAEPLADGLALSEEAGEVARAVLKRAHNRQPAHRPPTDWSAEIPKEAGDVVITLLSLAANEGWSLADAVAARWAEVRER